MRILHVGSGRLFGGVERTLATLAACDAAAGGRLHSTFALCASGRAVEEIVAAGGRVEEFGDVRLSRPASVWRARARLRDAIARHGIDAVVCHAPWAYALFSATARRARTRVVLWQHDAATGRTWIERWARATPADLVISNSRWTARSAGAIQPGVRVQVIYCPVRTPPAVDEQTRLALRASLETLPSSTVVLAAARLEPWKGQSRLVRALSSLDGVPDWTLWIAGGAQRPHEAAYVRRLRREAARAGIADRIRWLGERRDMAAVMGSADLLCQPNLTPEPFGVVFAEALLHGVPVVTTDMGGAPEIVDARCGRLVPPADGPALVSALRELIENASLRRTLGAAGPAHATFRCSPTLVMPRLAEALVALRSIAAA